jgi:hypothetical protein
MPTVALDLIGVEGRVLDHRETGLNPPLIAAGQGDDVLETKFSERFAGQN